MDEVSAKAVRFPLSCCGVDVGHDYPVVFAGQCFGNG
jgi:hypothetical protein